MEAAVIMQEVLLNEPSKPFTAGRRGYPHSQGEQLFYQLKGVPNFKSDVSSLVYAITLWSVGVPRHPENEGATVLYPHFTVPCTVVASWEWGRPVGSREGHCAGKISEALVSRRIPFILRIRECPRGQTPPVIKWRKSAQNALELSIEKYISYL